MRSGRIAARRGNQAQFGIEAVEADVEMHAPAACQAGSDGIFLAKIGAQPCEFMGTREAHDQFTQPLADAAPAVAVRHMGRHYTLTVEYRAVGHANYDRGGAKCGEMAMVDEIEALDVRRQLIVGQGVPEMCGTIGKGRLAVKSQQCRSVTALKPARRYQQLR